MLHVKDEIVTGFKNRLEQENRRYKTVRRQMRQQKSAALRQWYSVRSFLVSERGVWTDRFADFVDFSAYIFLILRCFDRLIRFSGATE